MNSTNVTIISTQKNWMESSAISQLEAIARLPGVTRTVGLPDLHGGKTPVGMAFASENVIYPHLIGNDIGCGMALFKTGVSLGKYSEKRWVSRLNYIRELGDIEYGNPWSEAGEESPIRDLGTLGGGNHFAEFQKVNEVFDEESFAELNLPRKEIALLIHCGSRGYGQRIFKALDYEIGLTDEKLTHYMSNHDDALKWAARNRIAVVEKLIALPMGISAVSTDGRSQHMNKKLALQRLCALVAEQDSVQREVIDHSNWLEHTRLERGNAVRVYEGMEFRRAE